MSKQEMARKLIDLGCTKSFNTLRKYSVDVLEGMLAAAMPATQPEIALPELPDVTPWDELPPCVTEAADVVDRDEGKVPEADSVPAKPDTDGQSLPNVPTDRELYIAALNSKPADVPVAAPVGLAAWFALALTPLAMLRGIVGV